MPIYLCNGSVCRMRTVRSFYLFKQTVIHIASVSQIISAETEAIARNIFWNDYMRPMMIGVRWQKQDMKVREVAREELERLLTNERVVEEA